MQTFILKKRKDDVCLSTRKPVIYEVTTKKVFLLDKNVKGSPVSPLIIDNTYDKVGPWNKEFKVEGNQSQRFKNHKLNIYLQSISICVA